MLPQSPPEYPMQPEQSIKPRSDASLRSSYDARRDDDIVDIDICPRCGARYWGHHSCPEAQDGDTLIA
jgi:hypothetical protein